MLDSASILRDLPHNDTFRRDLEDLANTAGTTLDQFCADRGFGSSTLLVVLVENLSAAARDQLSAHQPDGDLSEALDGIERIEERLDEGLPDAYDVLDCTY